ncbi:hypothetical protein EWB00_004433, partial [Schistosoma japonicum]
YCSRAPCSVIYNNVICRCLIEAKLYLNADISKNNQLRYQLENEGLDYIFSNDRLSLENIEINASIGNSDNVLITFEM